MSALLSQNYSKEGGVFYRDSNMNEVDVLIKEDGEITAFAVKSSCHFERSVPCHFERSTPSCHFERSPKGGVEKSAVILTIGTSALREGDKASYADH